MYKFLLTPLFAAALIAGLASGSMAGYNYHGSSMQMSEMSAIDSDNNGKITFEEFSAPTVDRLKSGFEMLDTDNDGNIDQKEWNEYLKVHGIDVDSES
jgi:Ca2+-binding EF-hand superfamily protein